MYNIIAHRNVYRFDIYIIQINRSNTVAQGVFTVKRYNRYTAAGQGEV